MEKSEHTKSFIVKTIQIVFVLWLFVITLLPVEVGLSGADIALAWSLPVTCLLGVSALLMGKSTLKLNALDVLFAVWCAYVCVRHCVMHEWACDTQLLQMGEMAMLYWCARFLFCKTRMPSAVLVFCVVACGCGEALVGLWQILTGESRHHLYAVTGTFLNPGPYSAYLMMGVVTGLAALEWGMKKKYGARTNDCTSVFAAVMRCACSKNSIETMHRSLSLMLKIACVLMLVVLPSTWSRAAWLSVCACAMLIFHSRYRRYRYAVWGAAASVFVCWYFVKQGSADGRLTIWAASVTSWLHSPLIGVGIGGFRHACAEGIAEMWNAGSSPSLFRSAGVTEYAYNELLKVLVEQGVVGAVMCLAVVAVGLCRLYRCSKALCAGLVSMLLFSMFSYPFEILPYRIIFILLLAWSGSAALPCATESGSALPKQKSLSMIKLCPFLCLIVTFAVSSLMAREIHRRADETKMVALFSGLCDAAFLDDYYEVLPDERDDPQFLFNFAKTLRQSGRYRDSNAVLRQGTEVSADPMFYVLMGNNYKDEQYYDLAEHAYEKAYAIMPNRLYPLYQLMVMYEAVGDDVKCKSMARRIVSMKPKVESRATKDMRKKAYSLLYE